MAKFEVGDKVKFLNQIGGGIVTKVTPDFVFVQDDTGFDMPMAPNELIRMADMSGAGKMFNEAVEKSLPSTNQPQGNKMAAPKPLTPEEEVKQLRNQVANLKDQVAKLKKQLENLQKQNASTINDNILLQHMVAQGEAEVDLHIEMLHEDHDKLSAHEVFEVQMRYFRLCMNHAFRHKMKRVVFIHGVGKGILKDEIVKELKQYPELHFFNAPMSKYGVGATEVYFPN